VAVVVPEGLEAVRKAAVAAVPEGPMVREDAGRRIP